MKVDLEQKNIQLERELERCKSELDRERRDFNKFKFEVSQNNQEQNPSNQFIADIDSLKNKNKLIQQQNNTLKETLQQENKTKRELEVMKMELEQHQKEDQQRLETVYKQISSLERELETLKKENHQLKQEKSLLSQNLQDAQEQASALSMELEIFQLQSHMKSAIENNQSDKTLAEENENSHAASTLVLESTIKELQRLLAEERTLHSSTTRQLEEILSRASNRDVEIEEILDQQEAHEIQVESSREASHRHILKTEDVTKRNDTLLLTLQTQVQDLEHYLSNTFAATVDHRGSFSIATPSLSTIGQYQKQQESNLRSKFEFLKKKMHQNLSVEVPPVISSFGLPTTQQTSFTQTEKQFQEGTESNAEANLQFADVTKQLSEEKIAHSSTRQQLDLVK